MTPKLIAIAVSAMFGWLQAPRPMYFGSRAALYLSKARAV